MIFKSEKGTFTIKGEINDALAYDVVKQMLDFLEKYPDETITLHI